MASEETFGLNTQFINHALVAAWAECQTGRGTTQMDISVGSGTSGGRHESVLYARTPLEPHETPFTANSIASLQ
jgi:hypothetical protein